MLECVLLCQVLDPEFRAPYQNVTRWFVTCVNQPQFSQVLGVVELCSKMAHFDGDSMSLKRVPISTTFTVALYTPSSAPAKKYAQLFPKEKKDKKEKPQQAPKMEAVPKKQAKPKVEEEEDEAPKPAKFIDPLASLPPRYWCGGGGGSTFIALLLLLFSPHSDFNLDGFKRLYSNSKDIAGEVMPWLWENMDREGWSLWKAQYDYIDDLKKIFMASNLVSGMFQRLDKFRKHGFSSVLILGEDDNVCIEGVWLMRGQELAFSVRVAVLTQPSALSLPNVSSPPLSKTSSFVRIGTLMRHPTCSQSWIRPARLTALQWPASSLGRATLVASPLLMARTSNER